MNLSVLLTSIGNRAYTIAVVAYVYDVTHSASQVAIAAALRYLVGLAASLLVIPLAERVVPKRMMLAANALCGLTLVGMALAVAANAGTVVVIALASLVRAATTPLPTATAAILPHALGGKDLAAAAGRQNAIDKMALLAGPAIGGVLLFFISPAVELLAVGALFLIAIALSLEMPGSVPARARQPRKGGSGEPQLRAASGTAPRAGAAVFAAFSVAAGFIYGIDTVLFEVLAQSRFHLGNSGYGLFFAGLGAGGLVAMLFANRVAARRTITGPLVAALWLYSLPTLLLIAVHTAAGALAVEAARGVGALLLDFLAVTGLQRILVPRRVPVIVSRITAGVSGSIAAGALLAPVLLSSVGLSGTLAISALLLPVLSFPVIPRLRQLDHGIAQRADELRPRTRVLERLGLMAGTSRPILEMLASQLQEETREPGEVVVTEGDASDDFYVIVAGEVEVVATAHRDRGEVLATLSAGDWFGEIAALTGTPRSATVRVTKPGCLFRIGATDFRGALDQLPPSPFLVDSAVARLSQADPGRTLAGYR